MNTIENVFIALGVSVGLQQVESILGIIILVIQFLILTMKFFTKIKMRYEELEDAIDNGNFEEVQDVLEDVKEDIEDYRESVKGIDNGNK